MHKFIETTSSNSNKEGEGDDPKKKKNKTNQNDTIDKIDNILGSLGIANDTKLAIIDLIKRDLTAFGGYLKGLKLTGDAFGYASIAVSAYQYINNPTTANLLNLTVSSGSIFLTPATSLGLGILDATGFTTKAYNHLGNLIDKQLGFSLGNTLYNKIQSIFVQPHYSQQ